MEEFEQFKEISEFLRTHMERFTNEQKLFMYGLYKQATVGDCNIIRPKDMLGSYKYDAWQKNVGMDADEAKIKYTKIGQVFKNKLEEIQ